MVIRGFPEEVRTPPRVIPRIEEAPRVVPPTAPTTEPSIRDVFPPRPHLDPNLALVVLGIVAVIGIIALCTSKK